MANSCRKAEQRKRKPHPATRARLDLTRDLILDSQDEWPMRIRRIYYLLMGRDLLPPVNPKKRNGTARTGHDVCKIHTDRISDDVARLRAIGEVPWDCIDDTHRRILDVYKWKTQGDYLTESVEGFLNTYCRDYFTYAPYYPEIWVEKDAASTTLWPLASELCIPLVICKGDSSVTYVRKLAERVRERMEERDQPTLLVYCSDLDPRGYFMMDNVMHNLEVEQDITDEVMGVQALLTPEQVAEFGLPYNPDGVKPGDSRYSAYVAAVGEYGVELDALGGPRSQVIVQAVIDEYCGEDFLEEQREIEEVERAAIAVIRAEVIETIEEAIE